MSFDAAEPFSQGSKKVCTTCPYCGVGCGVIIEQEGDEVRVSGDPNHPANYGRLCSKGSALGETLGLEDRILYPEINGRRSTWDAATQQIAGKFGEIIEQHGPDAVAFYVSGQLLTEDYYVANKLMKGYIGSANIDTNSRLCMASSVAGHKRAFGSDTVPGCYEDLEEADLVVLVGSNLAWCHPVLYQRLCAAKEARPSLKIVVVDPRRTATCDFADLHLALKPGSDVALFQGLLRVLEVNGIRDEHFVSEHTNGVDDALSAAADFDETRWSNDTGLSKEALQEFATLFCETEKTVTVYSQGVNQAADGSDRVNAIINCHLLTGRIGKPGMGPLSVTGQPNAMGGREVGGLANQLASHLELGRPDHRALVQRFWDSPSIADHEGLKAVDLFEAVHRGDVKAIWIMATNPVVSMPNADRVREALEKCDFVVVSDVVHSSDTAKCADVLLPSTAWGEKSGMVTNTERRMSRQRPFVSGPDEARHDWLQLCDVAKEMGWADAFSYAGPDEIFKEYAQLCSFENDGARDLDLSGVSGLTLDEYDAFSPQQWPVKKDVENKSARLFADGQFYTENGRANFVAPRGVSVSDDGAAAWPYTLNTGRIRDHWHTMTRTGRSVRLSQHIAEPFVEISPADALRERIEDADIVVLRSQRGEMLARALITDRQQTGSLFAPMHWTDHFALDGRVDVLTAPVTDPVSGQPALKSAKVSMSKFEARWYGFGVIFADFPSLKPLDKAQYWVKARLGDGARIEMAGDQTIENGRQLADEFFSAIDDESHATINVMHYKDSAHGVARFAAFQGDVLKAALYVSKTPVEVARDWIGDQLNQTLSAAERMAVLAARPGGAELDRGPIVCACNNIGANQITASVEAGCSTVDAIGQATSAGTGCGSCRAEIKRFLAEKTYA